MPGPSIRSATMADIDDIVALVTSAYRGETSRRGWTTEADLLDGTRITSELLQEDVADPTGVILVGIDGEAIVACINAKMTTLELGYLGLFAVRPDLQARGIGAAMLDAGRAWLTGRGALAIEMTVLSARIELIDFYVRRGFEPTGERRPFPYGDTRFGTPKRDDLDMVVLRQCVGP